MTYMTNHTIYVRNLLLFATLNISWGTSATTHRPSISPRHLEEFSHGATQSTEPSPKVVGFDVFNLGREIRAEEENRLKGEESY